MAFTVSTRAEGKPMPAELAMERWRAESRSMRGIPPAPDRGTGQVRSQPTCACRSHKSHQLSSRCEALY